VIFVLPIILSKPSSDKTSGYLTAFTSYLIDDLCEEILDMFGS
jgi:hypothetical protein